jgi:hypothetical protein
MSMCVSLAICAGLALQLAHSNIAQISNRDPGRRFALRFFRAREGTTPPNHCRKAPSLFHNPYK